MNHLRESSPRPRIGITVHLATVTPPHGQQELRFELSARYVQVVREAGGIPLLIPTDSPSSIGDILQSVDGLLLSGGGSLPSVYFEENPNPSLRQTNPLRYDFEVALVREAWARGVPLLGICRGHQTIAEALGGELLRGLRQAGHPEHYQTEAPGVATHPLTIEADSLLGQLLGREAQVNSLHRQVVSVAPPGWRASARSPEGLIEAMEAESGFGVGCQFHPEWLGDGEKGFRVLFEEFVSACAARNGIAPHHVPAAG